MTKPGSGVSLEQWQAKLLARIDRLARTYALVQARGFDGYDGSYATPEQEWRSHLDALEAERETIEQLAIELGIPPQWVERARTNGAEAAELSSPTTDFAHTGANSSPEAGMPGVAPASKQLFIDMAVVDVWHKSIQSLRNQGCRTVRQKWNDDFPALSERLHEVPLTRRKYSVSPGLRRMK